MTLFDLLNHPAAEIALRCYHKSWAGRRFESLGEPDARSRDANTITVTDIVAVSLLGIRINPTSVLDLLEGDLGARVGELLPLIPADVSIGSDDAAQHLDTHSSAQKAWQILTDRVGGAEETGHAWVTAGKLLARKRPTLIPVYDRVVRCVVRSLQEQVDNYWLWLNGQMQRMNVRDRIVDLRGKAGLTHETSPARVIDVILWMFHQKDHTDPRCRGFGLDGVPTPPDCAPWL